MLGGTKYPVPWREVLLRWLRPPLTLAELYRRMGWTASVAYHKHRNPHLQVRVAAQMAVAVGAPVGRFLSDLAEAEGIPALYTRLVLKPKAQEQSLRASGRFVHCRRCGEVGHEEPKCPIPTRALQQAVAQAELTPRKRGRKGRR